MADKKFSDYGNVAIPADGDKLLYENTAATNSLFQTYGQLKSDILDKLGGLDFQGTWNASTNTPTLTSSTGTKGHFYIVNVAGTTNLDGLTDWEIGDWAIFNGATWDKIDNSDVWTENGTDAKTVDASLNIDIQNGGLKDNDISTAIPLGDASNTSFSTTNKTIVGSVNELDTNKQPLDSDLTSIAGLSPANDDFIQRKAGAWSNRTITQVKTDLSLTGTNSGDQTITLTGDVTGSGTGSFASTIANGAVTNAKAADMATGTVKARTTAGSGDPEDIDIDTTFKTALNLSNSDVGLGNVTNDAQVTKATFDANTILKADTDDTPVALSVAASTFIGRKSTGTISAMSIAEAKTELGAGAVSGLATLDGSTVVPNAQISSGSITQHQGDIDHNQLTNYAIAQHRIINDAGTTTTELLSASKILAITASITAGIDRKESVDTSTEGLGNITLSGEQTLNGVTTLASRIVVVAQSTGADNGIYVTAAGAWARSADANEDSEVTNGMATMVLDSNSTKYRSDYILTTSDPITVGVTALTFDAIPALNFGTTAGTSAEGNDSRIPTQDENNALVGTDGTPSTSNKFVTNSDSRLATNLSITAQSGTSLDVASSTGTNATIPQSIAAGNAGLLSGSDKSKLDGIADSAIADVISDTTPQLGGMLDINGQSIGDGTLELLKFVEKASAVNELTVTNAATGNAPSLSATGDNTDIPVNLVSKGTGKVQANGNQVVSFGAAEISTLTEKTTPIDADLIIIEDSADSNNKKKVQLANLISSISVEAKTNGSASPYSILSTDDQKIFTNEGATEEVYLELPTAVAGLGFTFVCQDVDGLRVVAGASDTIRLGTNASAAAGNIKTFTVGNTIKLLAINATEWIAISSTGDGAWEIT